MATDYLLELDGIKGESKDSKHPNTIEIESFSWGAKNEPRSKSVGSGGLGGGKIEMKQINFATTVNKASGELMLACWTGKPIKKAVLYVRKQGENQQDYYVVTLDDALVTEFDSSGHGSGGTSIPMDSFSLIFNKVKFEYKAQKSDGSLEPPVSVGYDMGQAKKI
jgi:type VI secretion system secreted protein Hcp